MRNIGLDGEYQDGLSLSGLDHLSVFLSLPRIQITNLDLSENSNIGREGIKSLFCGLENNKTLINLNLAETKMPNGVIAEFVISYLMRNKVSWEDEILFYQ